MEPKESKPWYASKTIWINILMLVLTVAQSDLFLSLNLPPEWIATVITVVNFVLRFLTDKPVTATKQ